MNYENIKLEKGMYGVPGKSFTQILEDLDPTENYQGTSFEKLDAYQRQLKRFKINTKTDRLGKFFEKSDSAALFPEHISRTVKEGIDSRGLYDIIGAEVKIEGKDYRPLSMTTEPEPLTNESSGNSGGSDSGSAEDSESADSKNTNTENTDSGAAGTRVGAVSEGQELRKVNISALAGIELLKYGRLFSSPYETMKNQNISVLNIFLRKVGRDIADEILANAAAVLSSGSELINVSSITKGVLDYDCIKQLVEAIVKNYNPNVILGSAHAIADLIELSETASGMTARKVGNEIKIFAPFGAQILAIASLTGNNFYGFDKNHALTMITEGLIVDHDKAISTQVGQIGISFTAGFAKPFTDSVKRLLY